MSEYEIRRHHYPMHVNGPTDELTIYHDYTDLEGNTTAAELDLSLEEAIELAVVLIRRSGVSVYIPTPTVSISADAARQEMVHDLHRAVHGQTWAQPRTPKEVWAELVMQVSDKFWYNHES